MIGALLALTVARGPLQAHAAAFVRARSAVFAPVDAGHRPGLHAPEGRDALPARHSSRLPVPSVPRPESTTLPNPLRLRRMALLEFRVCEDDVSPHRPR